MGVNIMQPIRKPEASGSPNLMGAIGRAVGVVGGAFAGNPMAGMQVGGMVGDTVSGATQKAPEQAPPQPQSVQTSGNAISRKLDSVNSQPATQVAEGLSALSHPEIPPDIRQAAAQPLLSAYMKARGQV